MALSATYLGSSGWVLEFGNFRVLVDPWLTGFLTFPPGAWLIKGVLPKDISVPKNINLILLTQGLADHAHPPSLKILSNQIDVVAPPSASGLLKEIGFEKNYQIKPNESIQIDNLKITATKGAPVPNVENVYILYHPLGYIYI